MGIDSGAQERLAGVTVGLIGMGGIGTHLATHLAAAGVGRLFITDGDTVELSNLTRQTLFEESDVGRMKVDVSVERLRRLRSDLDVSAVPRAFTDPSLARTVATEADIVLLSADRPADVHSWVGRACLDAGIPFSASGYIEAHGSVGPLLHPPSTPCFECVRLAAQALPEQDLDEKQMALSARELNPCWQAPSYGPLNAIVAAVQANEAIRWLLGLPVGTAGRRLLLDSRTYETTWEEFDAVGSCAVCGRAEVIDLGDPWVQIAQQYDEERTAHSFNSVLLDDLVPELVNLKTGDRIADVGAGAGHMTVRLASAGAVVDAYEPAAPMRELLVQRVKECDSRVHVVNGGLEALAERPGCYDTVCCSNVLDHVDDVTGAVQLLRDAARPGGRIVLSVPHPLKDRGVGGRRRRWAAGNYLYFVLDRYFDEGRCKKVREDRFGNVSVRNVETYHRTVSRYLNEVSSAGLTIVRVEEPAPDERYAHDEPVIYSKASKVPYFLVVVAEASCMKDDLFSRDVAVRDFIFDGEVAAVFDDMLRRSIPFYDEIQRMAVELSCRVLRGGSGAVYDIGCSTGNTLMHLMSTLPADSLIDFFGVEPSDAMRVQFERKIAESTTGRSVKLLPDPVEHIQEMPDVKVIIMLFTLQFIRPIRRPDVLEMFHDSLQSGGILLLGEKVVADDSELNRTYIDLYHEFKRRSGYSDSEIARNRQALENVLVPYRPSENRALLEQAGFGPVDEVFRWYNFVLYVACKP